MRRVLSSLFLFALACAIASGQNGPDSDPDAARGYVNNVFHHSSVDSVNLYNGQLTIPIPLGPEYPIGPDLKYQVVLYYTSQVWEPGHPQPVVPPEVPRYAPYQPLHGNPALGIGWNFSLSAIKPCGVGQGSRCYVSPDGAEHIFNMQADATHFKTRAGDQLYLHYLNDQDESAGYEMWDGAGNRYLFDWPVTGYDDPPNIYVRQYGRGRNGWYLRSLSDPFGNGISVTYYDAASASPCPARSQGTEAGCLATTMRCAPQSGSNSWIPQAIRLPGGASISIGLNADQMIGSFTFPVFSGGIAAFAVWGLDYQTIGSWGDAGCSSDVPLAGLAAIRFPNDIPGLPSYGFEHNAPSAYLSRILLPTGGSVDYGYGFYSFYHGRVAALNPGCGPAGPDDDSLVIKSDPFLGSRPSRNPPNIQDPLCEPGGVQSDVDSQQGVLVRTETIPAPPAAPLIAVTDYTQYAFPFGEQGSSADKRGAQTLTVVVGPADVDGRRRAASALFWAEPRSGTFTQCGGAPLSPCPGDRTGADLRDAVYEADPNFPGSGDQILQPACGAANDNPFCPNHAVRVTQRVYDYDVPNLEFGNRRVRQETAFHAATSPDGTCPSCPRHTVDFSLLPGSTWEGNGRHYDIEQHSGNLGNDNRTITTVWASSFSPWLPNLFSRRTETEGASSVDQFFYFDASNGFLNGKVVWDAAASRIFGICRYPESPNLGNASQEITATASYQLVPTANPCPGTFADWPSGIIGVNGDAFGKQYTYRNGQRLSATWILDRSPAPWSLLNLFRDPATGWILASSDTAGRTTSYFYDSIGRVTSVAPPGGDAPSAISYDSSTMTTATRNGGPGLFTGQQYRYDGLGRLVREIRLTRTNPSLQYAVRLTRYDPAGHDTFVSEWVGCSDLAACGASSPASGTTTSGFDPFGRPQTIRKADGATTTISYAGGSSPFSDTQKSVTVNNINGRCTGSCFGGTSATTTYVSDAFGRLTSVTEPGGGDVTSYAYDVAGKLTRVFQGAQTRSFTYDPAGFLRAETTPEKGTVAYDAYGSLGNVLSETDPGGLVIDRTYDFAGRLTGVVSGGERYLTNCYDGQTCFDGSPGYAGGLYPAGKLTRRVGFNPQSPSAPTVTNDFAYSDPAGRLSSQAAAVTGANSLSTTQRWLYNGLGLLAHHHHPRAAADAPFVVSLDYDAGLPVAEYVNGIPLVSGVAYQASGALAAYSTGIGSGSVTTTIAPDGSQLPRPASISAAGPASSFSTGTYEYDGAGNILAMGSDAFAYDSRSRLTGASLSGAGSQTYSYDRYGNLTQKGTTSFCPGSCANNFISGATYVRGNLTSYGGQSFTWDGLDRMTSNTAAQTWSYLYDGGGERIAKIPPSPAENWAFTFRDHGSSVVSEYSGATPSRDNVFLGNQLALSYANAAVGGNGPVWTFYSSDHLGTPRLVTNIAGETVEARRYWPYGEAATSPGTFQALRFATMELDAEAGPGLASDRYYDHARSHVGGLARFLSPDAVSGRTPNPQTWNPYAYALNNPLTMVDLNGREPFSAHRLARVFQYAASAVDNLGARHSAARLFAGVSIGLRTSAAVLDFATRTGEAIGAHSSATKIASAIANDVSTVVGLFVAVKALAPSTAGGTITRYTGNAEARIIATTYETPTVGLDGIPRPTHVTTDPPLSSAAQAKQVYELGKLPTYRITVPADRVSDLGPAPSGPVTSGGGSQNVTNQPIRVRPDELHKLNE